MMHHMGWQKLLISQVPQGCCFDPMAQVTMADGTCKAIVDTQIGEKVLSMDGRINEILSIEAPLLEDRLMYAFNSTWAFVSEEHPIMTDNGWGAFNPDSSHVEDEFKGKLAKIVIGTRLRKMDGSYETVQSIRTEKLSEEYQIYNLMLDGDHTYVVEGFAVHNKYHAPPPRDYTPEWNQVRAKFSYVVTEVPRIQAENAALSSAQSDPVAAETALNNHIDAVIKAADEALAIDATIPIAWFQGSGNPDGPEGNRSILGQLNVNALSGDDVATHNDAVGQFNQIKQSVLAFKAAITPKAPYYRATRNELLKAELALIEEKMKAMGRYFNKPIEAEPAQDVYPKGSWQYTLWALGYSLKEVAWAEMDNATNKIIATYGDDFPYAIDLIKRDVDQAIIDKKIGTEVIPVNYNNPVWNPPTLGPVFPIGQGHWEPTSTILGVGTYTGGATPYSKSSGGVWLKTGPVIGVGTYVSGPVPSVYSPVYGNNGRQYNNAQSVPLGVEYSASPYEWKPTGLGPLDYSTVFGGNTVYGDDGLTYPSPTLVRLGVRYCATAWKWVTDPVYVPPVIPKLPGMPIGDPRYNLYKRRIDRAYQGRQGSTRNPFRNPIARLPYLPGYINDDFQGQKSQIGWNITGLCGGAGQPQAGVADSSFTPLLMGAGYTPDVIDTVRRQLRNTRVRGKTDIGALALSMAAGIASGTPVTSGSNTVGSGTWSTNLQAEAITKQSVAAQRQARRARRGIHA